MQVTSGALFSLMLTVFATAVLAQNEIADTNFGREPDYTQQGGGAVSPVGPDRSGWFDTARNAIAGPAGQMVVHMAKEMISRSAGNSQILSLNLSNLLVLILLKALIFAAGLMGAGNWGQYGRGRSLDSPFFTADEAPLYIGFLAAEGSGQDGCLNRAACQSPQTAAEYVKAAKAVVKGAEMFDDYWNTTSYQKLIYQVEQSIKEGNDGVPCDSAYQCRI